MCATVVCVGRIYVQSVEAGGIDFDDPVRRTAQGTPGDALDLMF